MPITFIFPKVTDAAKTYPLVLFMHDAGVTGTNPLRTLEQGLGAISFASPEDQKKHPAFVLAPQYPVAIANDASETSDYADVTVRLIHDLMLRFSIDQNRLYTTGQSGGCMTSIALNIKYPRPVRRHLPGGRPVGRRQGAADGREQVLDHRLPG